MTENLQTMLRESADAHPPLHLNDDPWARGRRSRRRRRSGMVAGVVVAGALVVGIATQGVPDMTADPGPASTNRQVTIPDTLYEVSSNVPTLAESPLGGPAAVLYTGHSSAPPFQADEGLTLLVAGAETDTVRVVAPTSTFGANAHALSPSGRYVAYGSYWEPSPQSRPPEVTVVDVVSGESRTFTLEDRGLGGGIERLVWYPGEDRLAVAAIITTSLTDDGSGGSGEGESLELDVTDGSWQVREHPVPESIAADAALEVRMHDDGAPLETAIPDGDAVADLEVDETTWGTAQFSPDHRFVAVAFTDVRGEYSSNMPFHLRILDAQTGREQRTIDLGEYSRAEPLGWGKSGLLVATYDENGPMVERIDIDDARVTRTEVLRGNSERSVARVAISADAVDAPARQAERPPRGIAVVLDSQWAEIVIVVAGGALVVTGIRLAWRRLRRRPSW